jgi:hypothetical protein
MGDIVDAIRGREFVAGLVFGTGALILAVASGLLLRRRGDHPLPAGDALLALAAILALPVATSVPTRLWWGIGLLVVGGLVAQIWPFLAPLGPALAAPGAWVVSSESVVPEAGWVRWFVFVTIVAAVPLVSRFVTELRTGTWTPMMFAIFSLGIFISVPDTEESLILLGASLPLALLSFPGSRAGFGVSGLYASLGLALWVIVQGGVGRPAAIIGASACLGLLLADPIARLLPGRGSLLDRFPSGWGGLVLASFVQLLLVVAVARTAGLVESIDQAVLIGSAFLGPVTVILWLGKPGTQTV